jgi:hypothetical protein
MKPTSLSSAGRQASVLRTVRSLAEDAETLRHNAEHRLMTPCDQLLEADRIMGAFVEMDLTPPDKTVLTLETVRETAKRRLADEARAAALQNETTPGETWTGTDILAVALVVALIIAMAIWRPGR